jgi:hypothetical protein
VIKNYLWDIKNSGRKNYFGTEKKILMPKKQKKIFRHKNNDKSVTMTKTKYFRMEKIYRKN